MPTYVVAFGNTTKIEQLAHGMKILDGHEPSDSYVQKISQSTSLLIMGKDVGQHLEGSNSNEFFSGWMINHEHSSIHLGHEGYFASKKFDSEMDLREKEGAFLHVKWDEKTIELTHDCFGLYPILSFQEEDFFVASDSLLVLSKIRSMMNINNTVNGRVHATRSWGHGLAQCIMSTKTIVKGIEYLPPASSIKVGVNEHEGETLVLSVTKKIPKMPRFFSASKDAYEEILTRGLKEIIGPIKAMEAIHGIQTCLGLSGGLDSRVLLACALHEVKGASKVSVRTNTHSSSKNDLEVVQILAEEYGFVFNQPDSTFDEKRGKGRTMVGIRNPFSDWALTNLGLFDMMYVYSRHWNHPTEIDLGGHGAEIIKGTFGRFSLFRSAFRYRTPMKYFKIRREINRALRVLGVPFTSKNKIQWHHLCYKSAIQNGRTIPRKMVALRPFMNKYLCSYGLHNPNNNLLSDLLIVLDERMASISFDDNAKNMSKQYIRDRKKELGHVDVTEVASPYTVFGTMENISNGVLSSFRELGKDFVLPPGEQKSMIMNKTSLIWTRIHDSSTRKSYLTPYTKSLENLGKEHMYMPVAGSQASKILSLSMTDAVQNESMEDA
ncbi:MAG: hypothetical protein DWC07_05200 [Candidatus Poseidoniales archaeon]|nr:MAG: hypothetical protein DWC07_05200 [Candidatus Poseidoniales archaeon]